MIGNVYAKFNDEEGASKAYNALAGKYYHSNLVQEEFSPVVNFRECRCRNYEEDKCERGGFCNFLHLKHVSHGLINSLRKKCMISIQNTKNIKKEVIVEEESIESMNIVLVNLH